MRRTVLVAGVALTMAVGAVAVALVVNSGKPESATSTYPAKPLARICGNTSVLAGPTAPPAGAVVVQAGDGTLPAAVAKNPAGTTFWLAPGVYTFGDNRYGQVIPKERDVFIGAPNAVLDGRNVNAYAFTGRAIGVKISFLTVQGFVAPRDEGVVNHDSGNEWTIERTTIRDNRGAGMMAGDRQVMRSLCLANNGQYGLNAFQAGDGISNLTLDHSEVVGNNADDWERKSPGCGCSGGAKFWAVRGAEISHNWIHDNRGVGLWADTNNVGFNIRDNYISDNDAEGIFYEISYNASITNNTFQRNALVKGRAFATRGDEFPVAALYLSESGGDASVSPQFATLEVSGNNFEDNWGGVTLWENADRFCNSPANTSRGYCAKTVSASKATCVEGKIDQAPYLSDCRWKTQNVLVHDNRFAVNLEAMKCEGSTCGQQAILANWGTFPSWSPYKKRVVQEAVTYHQNNRFQDNTYEGPWRFVALETTNVLAFDAWQAAPYGQDAGSKVVKPAE